MTLCIAAICEHQGKPAVVLCSDWRSETGDVAGGDVQDKLSWIVPNKIAALKAGVSISDADRVAAAIRFVLHSTPISIGTVGPVLDLAMQKHRWMLVDNFLQTTLGIDYAALIGGMKTQDPDKMVMFPDDFVVKKLEDIEKIPIPNCPLIITGFVDKFPILYVVNEPTDGYSSSWARVREDSNFVAIGSGAPAAIISLYRREHVAQDTPLMKACYNVFEAKVLGEVSPGVGDATSITVLLNDETCWDLTKSGHDYLRSRFNHFGPLDFDAKRKTVKAPYFQFKQEFFADYEYPWRS